MKRNLLFIITIILSIIVISSCKFNHENKNNEKAENPIIKFQNEDKIRSDLQGLSTNGLGFTTSDDEYIYMAYSKKMNYKSTGAIFRMNKDGSKIEKLVNDTANYINVIDDYIYYSNFSDGRKFYKINKDGTQREKITDFDVSPVVYSNGEILFNISADRNEERENDYIYIADKKNVQDYKKLYKAFGEGMIYVEPWLYFHPLNEEYSSMEGYGYYYRVKNDGSEFEKILTPKDITIYGTRFVLDNEFIVFINGNNELVKIDIETKEKEKLYSFNGRPIRFTVSNGWIYWYDGEERTIYRSDKDVTEKILEIEDDKSLWRFAIEDDWIIYLDYGDRYEKQGYSFVLHAAKIDGSINKQVYPDFPPSH